jgi:hypothetical protein
VVPIRAKPPTASIIEVIMNKPEPQLNVKDAFFLRSLLLLLLVIDTCKRDFNPYDLRDQG